MLRVLEVSWGHRYWVTAVAFPKWINNYHCLGLLKNACGPMLAQCCAMWCGGRVGDLGVTKV